MKKKRHSHHHRVSDPVLATIHDIKKEFANKIVEINGLSIACIDEIYFIAGNDEARVEIKLNEFNKDKVKCILSANENVKPSFRVKGLLSFKREQEGIFFLYFVTVKFCKGNWSFSRVAHVTGVEKVLLQVRDIAKQTDDGGCAVLESSGVIAIDSAEVPPRFLLMRNINTNSCIYRFKFPFIKVLRNPRRQEIQDFVQHAKKTMPYWAVFELQYIVNADWKQMFAEKPKWEDRYDGAINGNPELSDAIADLKVAAQEIIDKRENQERSAEQISREEHELRPYSLPKGSVSFHTTKDKWETPGEAAARELKEETGVEVQSMIFDRHIDIFLQDGRAFRRFYILRDVQSHLPPDQGRVENGYLISVDDIPQELFSDVSRIQLNEIAHN